MIWQTGHRIRPCTAGGLAIVKAGRAGFNYNWRQRPRSSVDRAPVSEAGCVSSILTGGAIVLSPVGDFPAPRSSVGHSVLKGLKLPGSQIALGRRPGIYT